jgi:4-aminobutyrate aminotransferase-like enzyme
MALAQISEIRDKKLPQRAAQLGKFLLDLLHAKLPAGEGEIRGRGLMVGIELKAGPARTFAVIKEMLHRGFILLPEGGQENVISFTPPLTITRAELTSAVKTLGEILS